ncbi:ABC transporter permease, partial [Halobacillus sp. BBL2006]|uniref:ABC transporter permease n=1 Tax=Halobacillus sp. BBL2006 TaxID=1543706 RepID=UPI0005426EB6
MRKIIAYTMNYKVSASIALSLMIVELIVELVQPLIMAKIIDGGIIAEDYSVVTLWGSVLVGLSFLAFTAGITNSFFAAHFSQGVGYDLRRDIFAKVQHFTHENFKQFSTPGLVTKMTNDVTQIQSLLFMFVRIALRAPLFIIFALVMSFSISVPLSLILVIAVPLFLAFLFWVLKKGVFLFKLVQHELDGLNTVIRENLTGIRLIKGFSREKFESNRFLNVNRGLMKTNKRALWLMEVAMPVVMLGMNASILIILWLGADKLGLGDIQAGELVAIINYATRIMFTFSIFTFLIMVFSRGNASAERIEEVLDVKAPSYLEGKQAIQKDLAGDVRFERVSFFHSQHPALHEVSFHASPGETVGLLG